MSHQPLSRWGNDEQWSDHFARVKALASGGAWGQQGPLTTNPQDSAPSRTLNRKWSFHLTFGGNVTRYAADGVCSISSYQKGMISSLFFSLTPPLYTHRHKHRHGHTQTQTQTETHTHIHTHIFSLFYFSQWSCRRQQTDGQLSKHTCTGRRNQ